MAKPEPTTAWVVIALGPELLFVALPFIVYFIVLWAKGDFGHFFYMPELSLASAVLLGQAIARFIAGILVAARTAKKSTAADDKQGHDLVVLFLTFAIVLGLVPVLVVLVLVVIAPERSTNLAWAQGILFMWTVVLYAVLAGMGQYLLSDEQRR
jgi:hypothetical protein